MKKLILLLLALLLPIGVSSIESGEVFIYTLSELTNDGSYADSIAIRGHIPITHPQQGSWAYLELSAGDSLEVTVEDPDFNYQPPMQLFSHTTPQIDAYDLYANSNTMALFTITIVESGSSAQIMDTYDLRGFIVSLTVLGFYFETFPDRKTVDTDEKLGFIEPISSPDGTTAELERIYNKETGMLVSARAQQLDSSGNLMYSWFLTSEQQTESSQVIIPFSTLLPVLSLLIVPILRKNGPPTDTQSR